MDKSVHRYGLYGSLKPYGFLLMGVISLFGLYQRWDSDRGDHLLDYAILACGIGLVVMSVEQLIRRRKTKKAGNLA